LRQPSGLRRPLISRRALVGKCLTLLRGQQGSSATPQLRTILPFRDLGLLRVNPAMPASRPALILPTATISSGSSRGTSTACAPCAARARATATFCGWRRRERAPAIGGAVRLAGCRRIQCRATGQGHSGPSASRLAPSSVNCRWAQRLTGTTVSAEAGASSLKIMRL
jgi:hypothetical protein